ncbi:hypothetical protein H6P81_017483 [Aristolochia fimbriata]|uniref:Integrase zinc-binding domain-containing protein n=1 Tax=Aristolochia fimbriata TaxID=158543 RepID=A0AAV7DZD8_ARIFI|nr:hypothetical protein H6P81_017483 [Aristolochia fimbriata]
MESPTEFGLTPVDWAKKFDATRAFKDNIVREGTSKAGATEEINKKSIEVWLEGVQEDQKEIIEIVKLEIEQLKGSHNEANGGCTIYKIPDIMREGEDPNIYRPTYLLVSPRYNQDISRHIFDGMRRDHYIFHVSSLLNRNISKSLEDYIFTVHAAKDEIRNCESCEQFL